MDCVAQLSIHSAVGLKIGEVLIADCDPFLIIGREHPIKVQEGPLARIAAHRVVGIQMPQRLERPGGDEAAPREEVWQLRSEEHTSELQSLMRISYAVFCLKNKNTKRRTRNTQM